MTQFTQGAPCWLELGTSDQQAAKRFYTELFGWTANDSPIGPGAFYTMFQSSGNNTGAAYTLSPEMTSQGARPSWMVYFAVQDADASAAKVKELGGSVMNEPFDVMDLGRMSICIDPGGAIFCLWQGKAHSGVAVFGENNTVCWVELATRNVPQAGEFYTALLGWETKSSVNMNTYLEFSAGGVPSGGLLPMDGNWQGIPSHWGIYFRVADCDAVIAKAHDLGATLRMGPHDAPGVGRLALMVDPQGAPFSVITLATSA